MVERIWIFGANLVVIVLSDELAVAEIYKLVVHCCANHIQCVAEILGFNGIPSYIELKAAVVHRTYIDKGRREKVGRNRYIVVAKEILLTTTEIVERPI